MLIMINAGKILFEEEKDFLLEKFRVVKGDVKYLSPDIKSLMLHFEKANMDLQEFQIMRQKLNLFIPTCFLKRLR